MVELRAISGTHIGTVTPLSKAKICGRCGVSHNPKNSRDPERTKFCNDCLPEAENFGWCPARRKKRRTKVAA